MNPKALYQTAGKMVLPFTEVRKTGEKQVYWAWLGSIFGEIKFQVFIQVGISRKTDNRYVDKVDNQQGLLYSTGNATQYSVIASQEKNLNNEYVYTYNWITIAKHVEPTQHCKSTTLQYNTKI